jgi:erythromycin esterase
MRVRRVLIVLPLMIACRAGAQLPDPDHISLDAVRSIGHQLPSSEPNSADLAPIILRLKDARVIGIGEVTHGTHEDQAFKAELIKALVREGSIDVLALEANRAAGIGFDRYVRGGEGDPAELIDSPSFFRIWKGDEFAGLLLWLRAWNRANPVHAVRIVGVDNQDGAVDAALALSVLARHDPAAAERLGREFGTMLIPRGGKPVVPFAWLQASKPGELTRALAAAAMLHRTMNEATGELARDPDIADARYAALIAWQNLKEFEHEVGVTDLSKLPPDYLSRRDRFMAENMRILLSPKERAVFWAHDQHVTYAVPAEIGAQGYTSIGVELRKVMQNDYRTVGFTYSRASVLAQRINGSVVDVNKRRNDEPIALRNDGADTLGGLLKGLPGDAWWIDLKPVRSTPAVKRFLATALWRGWAGSVVDPEQFQPESQYDRPPLNGEGFDVLVWFRSLTPQRRWPAKQVVPSG